MEAPFEESKTFLSSRDSKTFVSREESKTFLSNKLTTKETVVGKRNLSGIQQEGEDVILTDDDMEDLR